MSELGLGLWFHVSEDEIEGYGLGFALGLDVW